MSKIKNIIFDFGDIFLNLDKTATARIMFEYGFQQLTPELDSLFKKYEIGQVETDEFLNQVSFHFPKANRETLKTAWNAILLDFPEYRLDFLEELALQNEHKLFLLSNTNDLHIEYVKQQMGHHRYTRFKELFDDFYLSHEIGMRKPNQDIFKFVLEENSLRPGDTLFVDDTLENTAAASVLGIKTWHLNVGKEDVVELKNHL